MARQGAEQHDEDLVRLYLRDIGQHPLLTKDDEARLARAVESGVDAQAALAAVAEPGGDALTAARCR